MGSSPGLKGASASTSVTHNHPVGVLGAQAVALAIFLSLGGDSDTIACIAGSIAEAFYCGVPEPIAEETLERLPPIMRRVVTAFIERYQIS